MIKLINGKIVIDKNKCIAFATAKLICNHEQEFDDILDEIMQEEYKRKEVEAKSLGWNIREDK